MSSTGHLDEALRLYEHNLQVARERGDKDGQAAALHSLGTLYSDSGNYQEAVSAFEQSLSISQELKDKVGTKANLRQLADSHRALGNYKMAIKYGERALAAAEALGNKNGVALAVAQLGHTHAEAAHYRKALKTYAKSLKSTQDIGNKVQTIGMLCGMAGVHFRQGKYKQAVKRYDEAYRIAARLDDLGAAGNIQSAMYDCASAQSRKKELKATVKEQKNRFKKAKGSRDHSAGARALCDMADALICLGKIGDATKQCAESVEYSSALQDKGLRAATLRVQGRLSQQKGRYEEAASLHQEGLKLAREVGDNALAAHFLFCLGEDQQYLHSFHDANQLFADSAQAFYAVGKPKEAMVSTLRQVQVMAALGDYRQALDLAETGLASADKLQEKELASSFLIQLGAALEGLGHFRQAAETYEKAAKALQKAGSPLERLAQSGSDRVKGRMAQPEEVAEEEVAEVAVAEEAAPAAAEMEVVEAAPEEEAPATETQVEEEPVPVQVVGEEEETLAEAEEKEEEAPATETQVEEEPVPMQVVGEEEETLAEAEEKEEEAPAAEEELMQKEPAVVVEAASDVGEQRPAVEARMAEEPEAAKEAAAEEEEVKEAPAGVDPEPIEPPSGETESEETEASPEEKSEG